MTRALTSTEQAVQRRLARAVPAERFEAAWEAYEQARVAGLCHEGAWEVALGVAPDAAASERPPSSNP